MRHSKGADFKIGALRVPKTVKKFFFVSNDYVAEVGRTESSDRGHLPTGFESLAIGLLYSDLSTPGSFPFRFHMVQVGVALMAPEGGHSWYGPQRASA